MDFKAFFLLVVVGGGGGGGGGQVKKRKKQSSSVLLQETLQDTRYRTISCRTTTFKSLASCRYSSNKDLEQVFVNINYKLGYMYD